MLLVFAMGMKLFPLLIAAKCPLLGVWPRVRLNLFFWVEAITGEDLSSPWKCLLKLAWLPTKFNYWLLNCATKG